MKRYIVIAALSALVLCACAEQKDMAPADGGEFRPGIINAPLEDGETLGMFVYTNSPDGELRGEEIVSNMPVVCRGGKLEMQEQVKFPQDAEALDVYLYYPYLENASVVQDVVGVYVHYDQTEAEYYKASNLLFGKKTGVTREEAECSLDMQRLMSRIDLVVVPGEGYSSADDLADVEAVFPNYKYYVYIELLKSSLGEATANKDFYPYCGEQAVVDGAVRGISMYIPPQGLRPGDTFVEIRSGAETYRVMTEEAMEFKAGVRYEATVTVNKAVTRAGLSGSSLEIMEIK